MFAATRGGQFSQAPLRTFVALITQFFIYLFNLVRNFWQWVQPLSPITLLVIITLLLALAAFTLRGSMKAKS